MKIQSKKYNNTTTYYYTGDSSTTAKKYPTTTTYRDSTDCSFGGGYTSIPWVTEPKIWPEPIRPLEADKIVVSFVLMDGTQKTLNLKKYMEFCIRNHMMPEDCRDENEFNKILDEMKMVEEL